MTADVAIATAEAPASTERLIAVTALHPVCPRCLWMLVGPYDSGTPLHWYAVTCIGCNATVQARFWTRVQDEPVT